MKTNQEKYEEESSRLIEEVMKKNKQSEIEYPEYPDEKRQGLDAGNPLLGMARKENNKWFDKELKKLIKKYDIKF